MSSLSFHVARRKLSYRESRYGQIFDVVADGETAPFAVVQTDYSAGSPRSRLTLNVPNPDGRPDTVYFTDPYDSVQLPGVGMGYSLFPQTNLVHHLCLVFSPTRWRYQGSLTLPSFFDCPTVLSLIHKADRQMLDGKDWRQIAELHHAWRDSEMAKGIKGTFLIPTGLAPEMHLIAVLSAAAETIFHEEP